MANHPNGRRLAKTLLASLTYSMDGPVGFLKVWRGYPCNLRPWKQQNGEISMDFEGSEAGIVNFLRKMKVLGSAAGRRRESLQGAATARPGSNIVENVRSGRPAALPRTLATYLVLGP